MSFGSEIYFKVKVKRKTEKNAINAINANDLIIYGTAQTQCFLKLSIKVQCLMLIYIYRVRTQKILFVYRDIQIYCYPHTYHLIITLLLTIELIYIYRVGTQKILFPYTEMHAFPLKVADRLPELEATKKKMFH